MTDQKIQDSTFLKLLGPGGTPIHAQARATGFVYSLPTRNEDGSWTPGAWTPEIPTPEPCVRGYHVMTTRSLPDFVRLYGDAESLWIAEPGPILIKHTQDGVKYATNTTRLLRPVPAWSLRALQDWACDCAEHVLSVFESRYPNDQRPRQCIATTRAYLRGEVTREDVIKARRAAYDAAAAATYDAAAAATAAYDAAAAATYDAAAAATAATAATATTAAYDARADERQWQSQRLSEILSLPWE